MNFCVLGADARGTALAIHLIRQGHSVTLVPDRIDQALDLASLRENTDHLPGFVLPLHLQIGFEVKPVLMEADVAIIAGSGERLSDWCKAVAISLASAAALKLLITLEDTSRSEIIATMEDWLPGLTISVLSGMTHAGDLAAGEPISLSLAGSTKNAFLEEIESTLNAR